jgi:hypothetical protein
VCCTYIPTDNLDNPSERIFCDNCDTEIPVHLSINTFNDNQDRADRKNSYCQSDTSAYDNTNTTVTYIPPDSVNILQGAPHEHDLLDSPNPRTNVHSDNRNIKINKNPPTLDKETWDKIDIEFMKVNQNSWDKLKNKKVEPEQYIEELNTMLAEFLQSKDEFKYETKEYFKHFN